VSQVARTNSASLCGIKEEDAMSLLPEKRGDYMPPVPGCCETKVNFPACELLLRVAAE
jgi:hypothetical protein